MNTFKEFHLHILYTNAHIPLLLFECINYVRNSVVYQFWVEGEAEGRYMCYRHVYVLRLFDKCLVMRTNAIDSEIQYNQCSMYFFYIAMT